MKQNWAALDHVASHAFSLTHTQLSSFTCTQSLVKCFLHLFLLETHALCLWRCVCAHENPAAGDKDLSAALDARVDAQDCGGSTEGRQHSVWQFILSQASKQWEAVHLL